MLIPSCQSSGLDLTILQPTQESFRFADKRAVLAKYLSDVDRDELVVFTDGYDTMFVRGAKYIENGFARFPEPVVFSAELNSWPLAVVGLALYDGPPVGRYPYLNSGGFVGTAGDILDLCTKYPKPPSDRFELLEHLRTHGYDVDARYGFSDQYHWTLVRLLERDAIGLDHDARLFEYYGPPLPNVVHRDLMREFEEFSEHGRKSRAYQEERERLQKRLRKPSAAAQLHFASRITKAVILDMLADRELPAWISSACLSGPGGGRSVEVRRI